MRVDELVAGVKADVAASLYGDDLQMLGDKAKEIERVLREIPGGADVKVDYLANMSTITILPRRDRLAQYGMTAQEVMEVVESLGGLPVGVVFEGRARVPVVLRLPEPWREDPARIQQLPVGRVGRQASSVGGGCRHSHRRDASGGRARCESPTHRHICELPRARCRQFRHRGAGCRRSDGSSCPRAMN